MACLPSVSASPFCSGAMKGPLQQNCWSAAWHTGSGLSFAFRAHWSHLLSTTLPERRLRILVDPVGDRPCGSCVDHAQERLRHTRSLHTCPHYAESDPRYFGTVDRPYLPRVASVEPRERGFQPRVQPSDDEHAPEWYRSDLVQPVLVTLMLFQVVSGVILVSRATAGRSDLYRTLQTSTGAFLAAFIVSHLNAVFILGRAVTKVDTTFLWASGAPVGLLPDAWNVRLIPHYSLGVWLVITQKRLGLRGVLLAHRVSPLAADRVAWGVSALGAAFALTITVAQLSVHGAS